jgi:glycosyltransferase involved in cell wall biosynthesis
VDYVDTFSYEGLEEILEGLLTEPYFENLKLLVIDTLINLQCSRNSHASIINRLMNLVENEQNPQVFKDYFDYRLEHFPLTYNKDSLTIVQTMFYGDPFSLGIGNSGGLGLLLKNIGNSLAENIEVEKIITLTTSRKLDFSWKLMEKAAPNHYVFRMPLDLDSSNPQDFATKELMIKRTIKKHLCCLGIKPDIFHIRYLDNASLAVAKAATELKAQLVFTLTPDPHRNMVEKTGSLKNFTPEEALTLSNKIHIGDELLCMAQGVLGIGGTKIKNELKQYFPQLRYGKDEFLFQMIGEGIDTEFSYLPVDLKSILCNPELKYPLDEKHLQKPVILNVGRLNRIKAQDQLLKAFGESRLHQDFNLILIGGNRKKPTAEEKVMLNYIDTYMENNPELKGCFVHLDALSNEIIRSLENALSLRTPGPLPNIFVSSSKKEEFGLSILEALCEGWLVFAPTKGGVRTYLKNGTNGFLINTTSAETIMNDIENILYKSKMTIPDYTNICQNGRSTVSRKYSSSKIALNFLEFYKKVKETGTKW